MLGCDVRIDKRTKDGCQKNNAVAIKDTCDRKVDTKILGFFSTGADGKKWTIYAYQFEKDDVLTITHYFF